MTQVFERLAMALADRYFPLIEQKADVWAAEVERK
jgi:hypothetical protein